MLSEWPAKRALAAISWFVADDLKVPTCPGTWMHHGSRDIELVAQGGRDTHKPAGRVSENYRRRQPNYRLSFTTANNVNRSDALTADNNESIVLDRKYLLQVVL